MGVATVFEVKVPASTLGLAETFERAPDAEVRIERTAGTDRPMRFAWVSGVSSDRLPDPLAADPAVADAAVLGEDDGAHLVEVEFEGLVREFADAIFDRDGVVLRADCVDAVWTFQLRFADRDDVGAVFDGEFTREYEATVTRLYGSHESPTNRSGLTRKQRRALSAAFEMGYYSVPRRVDLEEVGERLGISRQAVSERLRRGHEALVADGVGDPGK